MLNKDGQRELAYVAVIEEIRPIPNYDRVEQARVGGWWVIVRKDQFKVGDLAIYIEVDSKVPEKEPFMFLDKRNFKVKTLKMCKVLSQGLLMAPEDFGWEVKDTGTIVTPKGEFIEGDFLTKELEITYADAEDNKRKANSADKYKKMAQRRPDLFKKSWARWMMRRDWGKKIMFFFFGKKKDSKTAWPAWVTKTDEERVQNMTWILEDKEPWIATEKIDGTSTTATYRKTGRKKHEYYICSRNVVFNVPGKEKEQCYYETNVYTEMSEKYHFEEVLEQIANEYNLEWVTLQGEVYGSGIQKRDYSMEGHDFAGFNLIFSDRGRLNSIEAKNILAKYGISWVPIVNEHFVLPDDLDELLSTADGKSEIDGGMREGLVFRSLDGARSFKAVSNSFLIKYH